MNTDNSIWALILRYSSEDMQYITTQLGMNAVLKSDLTQKNIIFQTCTKTP